MYQAHLALVAETPLDQARLALVIDTTLDQAHLALAAAGTAPAAVAAEAGSNNPEEPDTAMVSTDSAAQVAGGRTPPALA